MIERYIAPALTFAVLLGGHVAIVSALLAGPAAQADTTAEPALAQQVLQLEPVVITAKRAS
ncbi:MAG: hypothetical protein KF891_22730 [Rhizobacter sp.]|nr:hypothetical protein [Rhizobacter sp.]